MELSQIGGGNSYDEIVAALQDHGWRTHVLNPSSTRAQCPAHEGGDTNLAVDKTSEGKALVYCHSYQCEYKDIMEALELKTGSGTAGHGRMALRTHKYKNAVGVTVLEKTKYLVARGEQGFSYEWQTDYPNGKLEKKDRPPYNWENWDPEADTLYIMEGEKDADVAQKYWYLTTTSPAFGAGSWEDHWTGLVQNRFDKFVIVADNDEAGLKGAKKILAKLPGLDVEVMFPPEDYKDVADMEKAGLNQDDLRPAPMMTEETDQSLLAEIENWDEFFTTEHDSPEWLIKPLVLTSRATNLHAEAGVGKSELVLDLVARSGVPTLFLDREMTKGDVFDRLTEMGLGADDIRHMHYTFYPEYPPLDEPEGGEALLKDALFLDVRLVVLDSLSKFVAGDEIDNMTNLRVFMYTVNRLRKEGIAFLMVDHMGKNRDKGARGASAKKDNVDLYLAMERSPTGTRLWVKKKRASWVADRYDLVRSTEPYLKYEDIDGELLTPTVKKIAELLDKHGILPTLPRDQQRAFLKDRGENPGRNRDLQAAINFRKGNVGKAIKALDDAGLL